MAPDYMMKDDSNHLFLRLSWPVHTTLWDVHSSLLRGVYAALTLRHCPSVYNCWSDPIYGCNFTVPRETLASGADFVKPLPSVHRQWTLFQSLLDLLLFHLYPKSPSAGPAQRIHSSRGVGGCLLCPAVGKHLHRVCFSISLIQVFPLSF